MAELGEPRRGHGDWNHLVGSIYRAEFDSLVGMARRFLSVSASEEVVQEVFARFASMPRRPRNGSEVPYLRTMVMNEARSVLRRRQVHDRHLHRWVRPDDVPFDDIVVGLDEQREVRRRVEELSLRQRQVIALRYLHQLSEQEIADRLDISAGSVKTHSFRGIAALRLSCRVDVA